MAPEFAPPKDRARTSRFGRGRALPVAVALGLGVALSACTAQVQRHGHILTEEDLSRVQAGMSKDQVQLALGTPDTKTVLTGEVYYYISTTKKRPVAFMPAHTVDRRVLAVYFNQFELVERIAQYGLKDGKVFDYVKRETPSHGEESGMLDQIFRNLGNRQMSVGN